jgi:cytochrome c556
MKLLKLSVVLTLTALSVLAGTPRAFDQAAFEAAMKTILPTAGSLRKNVADKNADGAKADAAKLEAIFKTSEDFWTERKAQDAVDFSATGKTAAAAIGKLAAAGEWDKIPAEQQKIQATCSGCHSAHREGSREAGYKVK